MWLNLLESEVKELIIISSIATCCWLDYIKFEANENFNEKSCEKQLQKTWWRDTRSKHSRWFCFKCTFRFIYPKFSFIQPNPQELPFWKFLKFSWKISLMGLYVSCRLETFLKNTPLTNIFRLSTIFMCQVWNWQFNGKLKKDWSTEDQNRI